VWNSWNLEQEGKGREEKHKRESESEITSGFSFKYQVACIISLLVFTCMWFLGYALLLAWRISWIDSGFP